MSKIQNRELRLVAMLLILAGLVTACGSPASDPSDAELPVPPSPTAPPPTDIPPTSTPSASPTPEPLVVEYEDPEGDCLDNNNFPSACIPPSVDILTVTISEGSPMTIIFAIAAPGFDDLRANGTFGVIFGIDVDRDATTGHTSFWPEFHQLGPDIELNLFEDNGVVAESITHYAPDGTTTEGDPSQAVWTFLDDTHLQVVLSDELVNSPSIGIAGDLFIPTIYDHFVDGGHLTYPEGEVVLAD